MGVFGARIFADDDAADVRSDFRHFVADAQSTEDATNAIARQYGASFEDPASTTAFWLALALTQWKFGWLDPRVKTVALRILDDGLDLQKWENSSLRSKRAAALAAARKTIEAAQPPARPFPKPLPVQLPGWKFAEVIGVRMPNGRLALLHMISYRRSSAYGVKAPVIAVLNWTGDEPPSSQELDALTFINWRGIQRGNHLYNLASPKRTPLTEHGFIHLGVTKAVTRNEATSAYGGISATQSLEQLLIQILSPYWHNPSLPPHHPGFDKPEAALFRWNPTQTS